MKMEDVLSVYERQYDPSRPVVCVDEARKELRSTPRGSLPAKPAARGRSSASSEREDYEYAREGWANLFLAVEPLAGKRHVQVTEQRTAVDFARFLQVVRACMRRSPRPKRSVCPSVSSGTTRPSTVPG